MAHRGRLNVLVNLLGKSPKDLFSEFEGQYDLAKLRGSGDVKYHKGFSSDLKTASGNVHVALAFNPSHLEIVNPVVEGSVRARQRRRGDFDGKEVMPILLHGDAAFAIKRGERIAQMLIAPVTRAAWVEANSLDDTARGTGGVGSTGR